VDSFDSKDDSGLFGLDRYFVLCGWTVIVLGGGGVGKKCARWLTARGDVQPRYKIIINIIYLEDGPILHVVDTRIAFYIVYFLLDIIAKTT
jgi:hypothetical protein